MKKVVLLLGCLICGPSVVAQDVGVQPLGPLVEDTINRLDMSGFSLILDMKQDISVQNIDSWMLFAHEKRKGIETKLKWWNRISKAAAMGAPVAVISSMIAAAVGALALGTVFEKGREIEETINSFMAGVAGFAGSGVVGVGVSTVVIVAIDKKIDSLRKDLKTIHAMIKILRKRRKAMQK